MPIQKSRFRRLTRIVALLKENRYPNSESLSQEFNRIAWEENIPIDCSKKTIHRDFAFLKDEMNCPLAFDYKRNGYYLKHHGWDFISPAILDENEMLAAVIGARISESIFPPPLKNQIRDAVDNLLEHNNPDFLDSADISSLSILSGLYISLNPEIFMTLFEAWQAHRCVLIRYNDFSGESTERIFEPHTMVFYNNAWYSKGFCRLKNAVRIFAVHRIQTIKLLSTPFTPSREIIQSVTINDFLGFKKIANVKLKIAAFLRDHIASHPIHSRQIIHEDNTVDIPFVSKEILFPYLLYMKGQAELLAPTELRDEFKGILQSMLSAYIEPAVK